MLSKTGFTHSDLLCWQIDYAGGSLNVNGTIMRDTYISIHIKRTIIFRGRLALQLHSRRCDYSVRDTCRLNKLTMDVTEIDYQVGLLLTVRAIKRLSINPGSVDFPGRRSRGRVFEADISYSISILIQPKCVFASLAAIRFAGRFII
ncbi:hypothetical protein FOT72_03235 [Citrobacter amalonaticus]|uniref:Uncharacterized protein n=1 Tax=Citrobacter amalonaticus TaxID=35703 RepID=A0A8I0MHK7_CITAM|nr:hypothetical protein [Citrobacter amalonaticus]